MLDFSFACFFVRICVYFPRLYTFVCVLVLGWRVLTPEEGRALASTGGREGAAPARPSSPSLQLGLAKLRRGPPWPTRQGIALSELAPLC